MACRNDCSGVGTCLNGTCICQPGYSGIDDLQTANDCHVNTALARALHILMVVLAVCPMLVACFYAVTSCCTKKRSAGTLKLLLYADVIIYSAAIIGLYTARAIKPFSWDTVAQPTILFNEIKSAAIMSGVQVTNFLWAGLIPAQFSPPFVKKLKAFGKAHIHKLHCAVWSPYIILGLSSWGNGVGLPPWHVHTIDMVLVAIYCVPASVIVWRASFAIFRLAETGSKGAAATADRNHTGTIIRLWKHDAYASNDKPIKELILKLRLSVFLIVFCASGAIVLCVLMIPSEMGHVFRFHPEIWLVLMFTIGLVWHSGMLFLFKPKRTGTNVSPGKGGGSAESTRKSSSASSTEA